jgi:hypothetical protein
MRQERCIGSWWRDLVKRDHLEDWRIKFKQIFKNMDGGMYWVDLAQDRDMWRALMNAVMNLRVP